MGMNGSGGGEQWGDKTGAELSGGLEVGYTLEPRGDDPRGCVLYLSNLQGLIAGVMVTAASAPVRAHGGTCDTRHGHWTLHPV